MSTAKCTTHLPHAGAVILAVVLAGCNASSQNNKSTPATAQTLTPKSSIRLTDVTRQAGIKFTHKHGGSGRHYFVEFMGGGCAFLDYDVDGREDVLLVQGAPLPGYKGPRPIHSILYHNDGNGTFTDVTKGSGLDVEMYGMAPAVGDYDNDGLPDLFITAFGGNRLFHNEGNGKFRDVSTRAGLSGSDISTGAAWLDYDRDGLLDLFVCRYTEYSLKKDLPCKSPSGISKYCRPALYSPTHSQLYHNMGNGTFEDVTRKSGIGNSAGRSLGVAPLDYNEDGWPDIYVANDVNSNFLFTNNRNGTFREQAIATGAAIGYSYGGMGVDAGDYKNDGRLSVVIANFGLQPISLFHNKGEGVFAEDGNPQFLNDSARYVKWGCRFVDLDLDGWQDLFVVNGDVDVDIIFRPEVRAANADCQPCQVFRNIKGEFTDVSRQSGTFFKHSQVGRGAAFGDFDNDGDIDILIACNNEPAILLRNDTPHDRHWIQLQLTGSARPGHRGCNRGALGALVRVQANGVMQTQYVRSGTSYFADHDRRLLFGIGQAEQAQVAIKWPCGNLQRVEAKDDHLTTITEIGCKLANK